jgi:2-polyprenyl-6-methoxyphenol hydroxylase-like FAD-dependent oxidoreductase
MEMERPVPPAAYHHTGDSGRLTLGPTRVELPQVMQIWGPSTRAGLYPLAGGQVYWYCCFDCGEDAPYCSSEEMKEHALRLTKGWHFEITECIENTPADVISRGRLFDKWRLPTSRLGVGAVTLAGDALHPMTPNLGQVRGIFMCTTDFPAAAASIHLQTSCGLLKPIQDHLPSCL